MALWFSSAQHIVYFFEVKYAISGTNLQMKATYLFDYLVYAIKQTISFMYGWFGFGLRILCDIAVYALYGT